MRSGRLGIGVLFISALLNSFAQADPKVEEQILAPAGNGSSIIISEHGVHVAVVGLNGSRMGVSIDGVAGPVVDQILLPNGQPFGGGNTVGVSTVGDIALPVLFSPNGDHYAYAAKIGNDAVIFHDGKEITRGPYNASVLNFGPLCFSPSGKHLFFILTDTAGGVKRQFMMDGKPVSILPQENPPAVYFSPDESRYMYYAMSEDHSRSTLVVDGKDSGYFGNHLRFSSDNKVLCVNVVNGKQVLLIDGKPGSQGDGVTAVFAPRAGNTIITINTRPNPGGAMYYLVVDGKKIDASECINNINKVVFSPDGKRYMARCNGQGSVWMIVDGKKELEYQGIGDDFGFSADSTKYAYIASNASKQFVITDGAESSPYDMIFTKPIFSPAGAHLAYIGGANRLSLSQVVDGKVVGQLRDVGSIGFSADGSHFAFLGGTQGGDDAQHIIDGTPQKEIIANDILFTPDGKHVRLIGQRIRDRQNGLFVDGQVIYRQVGRFVRTPVFSPDSNHIYWSTVEVNQSVQPPRQSVLYVDGKAIGKWNGDANAAFEQMPESWEIAPDGVLTYLVIAPEGVKRLRVTPDANTTLASIVSDVKAAEEKAAADAAKSKADAEALRAKQAADAQKAREDAAAARAKARQYAIDARVKAQQDAAAARAARRGGTR